ncbi:hypothetical protein [uncultured Phenylobacterium sp.]|uniref:hypothetical protein n=1 Tax=uncultured Phenylobacterium sp. TaxID=349273 RepID=UPI0025E0B668|nr:hypothetical protein [uncultured Phenylobacterium sp.]
MDGQDKLPEDGRIQPQPRGGDAPSPLADGGEKIAPERLPAVKRDDSVEPAAEPRTLEGIASGPEPRAEPDPSVSHGQSDDASGETARDDGRR